MTNLVPAAFGRSGTKVHLAYAIEGTHTLTTSVPLCGTYTRPGSGWARPGVAVTCAKCQALAAHTITITDNQETGIYRYYRAACSCGYRTLPYETEHAARYMADEHARTANHNAH
jgi:hypothetical protein